MSHLEQKSIFTFADPQRSGETKLLRRPRASGSACRVGLSSISHPACTEGADQTRRFLQDLLSWSQGSCPSILGCARLAAGELSAGAVPMSHIPTAPREPFLQLWLLGPWTPSVFMHNCSGLHLVSNKEWPLTLYTFMHIEHRWERHRFI